MERDLLVGFAELSCAEISLLLAEAVRIRRGALRDGMMDALEEYFGEGREWVELVLRSVPSDPDRERKLREIEALAHSPFAAKAAELGEGVTVHITQGVSKELNAIFKDLGLKPDLVAIKNGAIKGIAEVKSVSLDTFKKELREYATKLTDYAGGFAESSEANGGFRQFLTRQQNIDWLLSAAARESTDTLRSEARNLIRVLQEEGFGVFDETVESFRPYAIPEYDDTFALLRP